MYQFQSPNSSHPPPTSHRFKQPSIVMLKQTLGMKFSISSSNFATSKWTQREGMQSPEERRTFRGHSLLLLAPLHPHPQPPPQQWPWPQEFSQSCIFRFPSGTLQGLRVFFPPPQGLKMSSVGDAKQSSATTQFLPAVYSLWMLNYRWPFDLNTSGVLYVQALLRHHFE